MAMRRTDGATGVSKLPQRSPRARRLASLEDGVVQSLAEDQALLVESVIRVYHALVDASPLLALERRRGSGLDAALAAAPVMEAAPQWGTEAGGQHHGCRCHHNCAAPSASDALRLLGDVDAAIAWCEGKAAVTALLFPPAAHRIHRPRHSSHTEGHDSSNNNNNNSKMKVRGSTPSDEEAYSHWQEPQVMPRRNAPHDYYETPDGNIRSCSSSRSRARQPITSPPTLPCTATRGVDDGGCNLDFDRWTARQIAAQAQHDKRRLWLLRCVAEEAVRRHAVIVEERLGRIALLVTAREEVAAVAGFLETEQWMKQQHNNVCERLLPSTYRPLGEGMTFVEASPPEPQKRHGRKEDDLAPSHRDGDEQKALGISCAAKGVQTFVSGPCVSGVAWSSFTYALLHSSENMQRLHIDKEAQLSWQLLLAQWQSVVNHVNIRRLIAAKEGLIHELATELSGLSASLVLRGTPLSPDSDRESGAHEPQLTRAQMPPGMNHTSAVEVACSRSTSLQSVYVPSARQPAQPHNIGVVPPHEGARWVAVPSAVVRIAEEKGGVTEHQRNHSVAASPAPSTPPSRQQQQGKLVRIDSNNDIAIHICTSVERVERKQVALTQERAWQELEARLHKEWEEYGHHGRWLASQ